MTKLLIYSKVFLCFGKNGTRFQENSFFAVQGADNSGEEATKWLVSLVADEDFNNDEID